jgi:hypothetical protein
VPEEQNTEERWRALAEEAFFISRRLADPAARRIMLRIAEGYSNLADRAKLLIERNKKPE